VEYNNDNSSAAAGASSRSGWVLVTPDATGALRLVASTRGTLVRLRGRFFGLCPVVHVGDVALDMCADPPPPRSSHDHNSIVFEVPEGTGARSHLSGQPMVIQVLYGGVGVP
jgi:hypothetical protein